MMIRSSKYGKFHGCSGFPECRHIMPHPDEAAGVPGPNGEVTAAETMDCPNCGKPMQKRKGRFGDFWGCTGYPDCKTIVDPKKKDLPPPDPDFSMACPRPGCGGTVLAKRSMRGTIFYGCSNYNAKPKCEYVAWNRPEPDQRCEECGYPMAEKIYRNQSQGMKCTNAECSTNPPSTKPKGKPKTAAASKATPAKTAAAKSTAAKSTATKAKAPTKSKTAAKK
jgi:DNA topoisomerase-1